LLAASAAAALAPRPSLAAGPPRKNLLAGEWPVEKLSAVLIPRNRWRPFPAAADRAAWQALPAGLQRSLLSGGEQSLKAEWPGIPATMMLEFTRIGVRANADSLRSRKRDKLRDLVLAECVECKDRFLDDIANGIWSICEETYWGSPAHLNMQQAGAGLPDVAEPTVDLFSAETSALLAWTDYLLGAKLDSVSRLLRPRIWQEVDRRVLTPNWRRVDFGWMGLDPSHGREVNNWNPWINSNWLTSTLLLEHDEQRRVRTVHKIIRSLDRFLDSYHDDGGCDEGPGYWNRAGGSLFDNLELLRSASNGAIHFYSLPLVREIGRYIYRAHIHDLWYLNFADAAARLHIAGDVVCRYGRAIGDEKLAAMGAWAVQRRGSESLGRTDSIGRNLPAIFDKELRTAKGYQPLVRDVWLPGTQVFASRLKEGSPDGLYLAAQGGHNAESHNHNDVGNFVVFSGGDPIIIDIGVETYTAKTFSKDRYTIWTMQSAWHNCPTIGGVMQLPGKQYAASECSARSDDSMAEFTLNIANAYGPEAGLDFWRRTMRLDRRKNAIEIRENYSLKKAAGNITLTLMTPVKPAEVSAGMLALENRAKVLYDSKALRPVVEEVVLKDGRLRASWGERLYRVLLTADKPPQQAEWSTRIVPA
jgi:hypothetical protein